MHTLDMGSAQRNANRSRVVRALRRDGAMSRGSLAEIGLSRSTVKSVVEELLHARIVVEVEDDKLPRGTGRPPIRVGLNGSLGLTVGIEVANDVVRVAVCNLAQEVLVNDDIAVDSRTDPVSTLIRTSEFLNQLLARIDSPRSDVIGVGIAMPGPIQRRTGLNGRACTLKPWVGVDPRALATEVLRLPVMAGNDANLAALAEVTWGAARGLKDIAYVYTATGIGAGFVIDGRVYVGANGTAGEIGHTTIDENGLVCECGGRGCLNTLANADSITEQFAQSHRNRPTIAEVIALAHGGDAGSRRVLADAGSRIGVAMANMYNLLDPELIVLGGNLAPAGSILLDPLRESMARRAIHAGEAIPPVVAGELDGRVVVLGAAAAVLRDSSTFPLRLLEGG